MKINLKNIKVKVLRITKKINAKYNYNLPYLDATITCCVCKFFMITKGSNIKNAINGNFQNIRSTPIIALLGNL